MAWKHVYFKRDFDSIITLEFIDEELRLFIYLQIKYDF